MTLGVMVNDLHNPFFAEAIDGIAERAERSGYQLLLTTGGNASRGEGQAIETMLRFRVDGLILTGPRLETRSIVEAAAIIPTVLLGRSVRNALVDTVNNDERVGARLAVEHLVELGHRHIAHIDGGRGAGAPPRRSGYEAAMLERGLGAEIVVESGDFTERSGAQAARRLMTGACAPTAIFAANDLTAAGAMGALGELGLRVPRDVSIVGYDNSAIASMHHMSLTTIDQPREAMGQVAVELLLERLAGERSDAVNYVVTPTLVPRSSTGAPRTAALPIPAAEGEQ